MTYSIKKYLSALVLVSLTTFVQAASDQENIKGLLEQYQKGLNTSQTESILKLYGEQSIFMPQHAPAQIGKAAIEQAYNHVFKSIKLEVNFTIHQIEVFGNTAWARTSSAGKTKILADDMVINESNNELFIFKQEQGEWKIHQYLFATSQPRQ